MNELFIYWRLERADLPAARTALAHFQATLEAEWPGLEACLYERVDDGAELGLATVMETYGREGGIAPGLHTDIVTLGAQAAERWCRGARHVEVFRPLPR